MSGYDVEHDIKPDKANDEPPRRPDLSSFFSALERVDTSHDRRPQNVHALPEPSEISAALRMLADAFGVRRSARVLESEDDTDPLDGLISYLDDTALNPPRELEGVSDTFLADLERIPKAKLKPGESCPICANEFLEDKYPLVVRLPCHKDHMFDLECITPWLKVNPTCPMDRQKLTKDAPKVEKKEEEDDEEEYDDMYA
ncbi:ring finger domain-containing protein 9 [Elsinoe australis]|uniref:Ring finger domain-containing protein 9 n=1 Tax=Elsinoe australis TaxID=40998 RepID=A0A4U7AS84_9PEZI|nr:ring finger domain-containing protein 9 [Elsinoe australis]